MVKNGGTVFGVTRYLGAGIWGPVFGGFTVVTVVRSGFNVGGSYTYDFGGTFDVGGKYSILMNKSLSYM